VSARPRAAAPRRPARRESAADRAARTRLILRRLKRAYPDARCALDHADAYQLLVATILSAQCTDARVNLVTPAFFARWPDAAALAAARPADVEEVVRSTGFFRNKARNLVAMAQALVAGHGGEVPASMEALRVLPGVGRKTANVVLGNAFGIDEGITVDTHVGRLARRLGLTEETDPVKAEMVLNKMVPAQERGVFSLRIILHGRAVCVARRPRCDLCVLADFCPSAFKV